MQHPRCVIGILVDHRHVAGIGKLPLLLRTVEITAFVIQVAQTFLEACFGNAADKSVDKRRTQISVPIQKLEYLNVARGEFNAFSRSRSAHSRSAWLRLH